MAFEVRPGSRGPTALWNGRQLASAYAPDQEAKVWADSKNVPAGSLVFVAGDPLGLATAQLRARGLMAVALLPGQAAEPWVPEGVDHWSPETGTLEEFLSEVFDRTGPDAVVWEVWPGFERLAPETTLDWSRRFRDLYRTVQGSWLTQQRFGRRYWHNAVRNLLDWRRPARLVPGTRPLVIAASGPSLDDGLTALGRYRQSFDLWALPSSFETLVRRGLTPDAGVATDGGFYAREHLHRLEGTEVPVLAALSSAPDPVLARRRCLFFSQGIPGDRALLSALGSSYPEVPSQGTVAVTALRLALEATTGPVFIAGLDLAFRDLRGHTSPHTVDRRLEAVQNRLTPAEGLWAQRLFDQATVIHDGVRTSQALLTYARWFQTRSRFSRTVYRLAPSGLRWSSMTEIDWAAAEALWAATAPGRPIGWTEDPRVPNRDFRRQRILEALATLGSRVEEAAPDDPWLIDLGRTAAPEALAEDFRIRRSGGRSELTRAEVGVFLADLAKELG